MNITQTEIQILEHKVTEQIEQLEKDLNDPSKFKTKNDWKNVITIKEGDENASRNESV